MGAPQAFFPRGERYKHSEPVYSHDGKQLNFLSDERNVPRGEENETIWYADRMPNGWSKPQLLTPVLDSFKIHWQFSFDLQNNLYFGGKSSTDESGEIYFSKYKDGKYENPQKLPDNINTHSAEFSPFISPHDNYLIFSRLLPQDSAPPQMNLFISFRDRHGKWQKAKNLTDKIELPEKTPIIMMSQARVTPDGKYIFFTFFNGKGHMVYWINAEIIENQIFHN